MWVESLAVWEPCLRVADGERIKAGPWSFDVIAVPGHTIDSVAQLIEVANACSHLSQHCNRLLPFGGRDRISEILVAEYQCFMVGDHHYCIFAFSQFS